MNRLSFLSATTLAACLSCGSLPASAQEARVFNIPAGSLRDALNLFAAQSDQQILFSGDLVAGRRTVGLSGAYAPSVALDRLLAGTGLVWRETRPGVIFLGASDAAADEVTRLEEVIVTGSLLRGAGPLSSPVVVLDRDALDRRGRSTVADVLAALPQNYAGSGTPAAALGFVDPAGGNSALATGINLRGLGVGSTLTLVNGRRLAGTGSRGAFSDASALPSAAVARVDVLLDGASALYKPDAVSPVGASGLTQLMPATALELGVRNRFDPVENLRGGADYLARQILRFGDLRLALAAYNSGPGRVARLGRVPDIAETRAYVAAVIECYLALSAGRVVVNSRQCQPQGATP